MQLWDLIEQCVFTSVYIGGSEIAGQSVQSGFHSGSDCKEYTCNAADLGLIPGQGRSPWRREWQLTPVFLPGESHGQRSLAGYNPWGCKESDTTERLSMSVGKKRWM